MKLLPDVELLRENKPEDKEREISEKIFASIQRAPKCCANKRAVAKKEEKYLLWFS